MKKSTKISLLVSLILVIAGAVCIFISLLGVGFDMRKFSNMTFEKKVFEMTDSFEVVHIIEENDDIELYLSEDNTCKIICYDSEEVYHKCYVDEKGEKRENGYLRVLYNDERVWYEKFLTLTEKRKIQIYLPDKAYKELAVHTVNSNIDVPKDFTFEKTNLHTVNGKINLNCSVTEWVSAETTNGVILLTGELNGKIHADTVNGKITADHIKNAESADFHTTNAGIEVKGDVIKELNVHSVNGGIRFVVKTSDGIHMETVNGKITGTVPANKKCVARTANGKISVPDRVENDGDFYFKTVNGNIDIKEK